MINLIIIIVFSFFISYLFFLVTSNKWLPSRKFLFSFIIGCSLVPTAMLIEKQTLLSPLIVNNETLKIFIWVIIEELLKILSLFLFIKYNKGGKNNVINLFGIGIGFSFVESIIYSQSSGIGLFSGLLNTSLTTLTLRSIGSLILHISTIAIVSLGILYFKNKRKYLVSILSIISAVLIHFIFNFSIGKYWNNFLVIFSSVWLLFLIVHILNIYLDYRNNDLLKIKKFTNQIAVFIGKYLLYLVFIILSLVLIDSGVGGLKNYSKKDIEQAKIAQQNITKSIVSWREENLPENYKIFSNEIYKIRDKLDVIEYNYNIIISLMEKSQENLPTDDLSFLRTNGSEELDELNKLIDDFFRKYYRSEFKSNIKILEKEKDSANSWLNSNKINNNQKKELSLYIDMINVLIKEEENFLIKLEENSNMTKKEIDELLKPLNSKFIECKRQGELLTDLIKKHN